MTDEELQRFAPDWADLDVLRAVYAAGLRAGLERAAEIADASAPKSVRVCQCAEAIRAEVGEG